MDGAEASVWGAAGVPIGVVVVGAVIVVVGTVVVGTVVVGPVVVVGELVSTGGTGGGVGVVPVVVIASVVGVGIVVTGGSTGAGWAGSVWLLGSWVDSVVTSVTGGTVVVLVGSGAPSAGTASVAVVLGDMGGFALVCPCGLSRRDRCAAVEELDAIVAGCELELMTTGSLACDGLTVEATALA